MKKPELIIYDFDGTLCNTLPDIAESMNVVLEERGLPRIPEMRVRDFIGSGITKLVERSIYYALSQKQEEPVSTEEIQQAGKVMAEYYRRHLVDRSHLYPGVKEVLNYFRDIPQIVVSNKPESMVYEMLEHFGIEKAFSLLVGGDTLEVFKPDPAVWEYVLASLELQEPLQGWMVGDSLPDLHFAKVATLTPIVVSYGYNDIPLLREAGAEVVIDDLRELIRFYEQL